jgi:hypothetical protein
MFVRTMIASLAALLVAMPMLAGEASAQPPGDWDRGGDRGPGRDRDRGRDDGRGRGEWELLGTTRVGGFRLDRDTIDVGRREGRFGRIGLIAREGAVFVDEVIVVFANGEPQRISLRQFLREGERTPPIDLLGRDRAIRRIEVTARGRQPGRRRSLLEIYGESDAPGGDWQLLGEKVVSFRVDRDIIRVGAREGRFEKIAFAVYDNDIEIMDLKVHFRHGPPQDLPVRQFVQAGARSRPVDLIGGDRVIDRIEFVYRTRGPGRERARVAAYGLRADGRGPGGPRWEELGCGKVGIKPDHDTIRVGRREGRFSAIQLRVSGNKVHIIDLTVLYDRGPPDNIPVRSDIRDGGETRPLDLRGERRVIDRVELTYRVPLGVNLLKGPARVCVYGR